MIDPERGHDLIKKFAKFPIPNICTENEELRLNLKGVKLRNPIGLAAGFDKNAEMISFLSGLGFGYLVIGSVLLNENKGNPKPRIVRYEKYLSMVNSMGLPSVGLRKFLRNLTKNKARIPLFVSIAGNSVKEFIEIYNFLKKFVNVIEVNLSCPNTENGRLFLEANNFQILARELEKAKSGLVFVKVSPIINKNDRDNLQEIIEISLKHKIDGITAVNALPVEEKAISVGFGGLSGKLLFKYMLDTVSFIQENAQNKLIINACGGIFNEKDAIKAFLLGASTVQLYTSLIYEGPYVVCKIKKGIYEFIKKNNFKNIEELIGYFTKIEAIN